MVGWVRNALGSRGRVSDARWLATDISLRRMQLFYLAVFLAGSVLGVYTMIRGVERIGTAGRSPELDALGRPVGTPRMVFTAPSIGAFATVFGVTGYLLWRFEAFSLGGQLSLALGTALLAAVLATLIVAHWANQAAEHDVTDERYLLQGHPAHVVSPIAIGHVGKIAYLVGGTQYAAIARSVDGTPVAAGTEVVIDRVEDGVAYVEPWAQVEQRL